VVWASRALRGRLSFAARRASDLVLAYNKSVTFRNIVQGAMRGVQAAIGWVVDRGRDLVSWFTSLPGRIRSAVSRLGNIISSPFRSEEHTSELQSRENLVCRLLLE